jgi:hypothetical protein
MIDTRMIRKDGHQYVQIIKDGRLIDEVRLDDWCELRAVRYAMEMTVEAERATADC